MSPDQTSPQAARAVIREAVEADVLDILRLIKELAEYEKSLHHVQSTEEHLRASLFPADGAPGASALVAEVTDEDGSKRLVGMAVWYVTFSTWTSRHGIWLEDLFVQPQVRGQGLGRQFLTELAKICTDRKYPRLEWWVLDWNEPAIGFYESLGAVGQDEWTVFRIDGDALQNLADRA
ncbi:GNAT family N-acetyltransferase [Angustibacter sp. McL0619]|uniref:GNAT family N-acetyltransferase n=1 Tax=Angustibacter sp. McL0619 TaxID=3415676 RepID=UPI003CF12D9B